MALRLACKINSKYVHNIALKRALSVKHDVAAASVSATEDSNSATDTAPTPSIQYSVCKPRAAKFGPEIQLKSDDAHHLQPAMLPEYYQPPYQMQVGTYAKETEESRLASLQQGHRRFEQSKTYANITLPIKAQKLANPFPDPVKMMASHTVSDQEKANQMLAESRVPSGKHGNGGGVRSLCSTQIRRYSSGGKKKANKCGKGKCNKMKQANCECPQAKSISCKREQRFPDCEKIDAPYPAYSESCHEDPDIKPSECNMCPWKPNEHPHFKTKKREMHTSCRLNALEKPGCPKPTNMDRKPCGYIKKKKPTGDPCGRPKGKDSCKCSDDCKDGRCEKIKSPCRTGCHDWMEEMEAERKAQESLKAEEKNKSKKPKKRSDGWSNAWENYAMSSVAEQESLFKDDWIDTDKDEMKGSIQKKQEGYGESNGEFTDKNGGLSAADVGGGAVWSPRQVLERPLGYQMSSPDDDDCVPKKKKPCCVKIDKGPCFDDTEEEEDEDDACEHKTPGTYKCPPNLRKAIREKQIKDKGGSRQEQLQKHKRRRDKDKEEQKKKKDNTCVRTATMLPPIAYEEPAQAAELRVD